MHDFNIPILVVTYKRHDTTFEVLKRLKTIQAKTIYISSNHWKNDEEKEIVLSLREKIKNFIDWNCDLHMIIRTEHLKVKDSFSSAIDAFFQHEDMGIILEDDTVPNQSFFYFCQEMLEKYKENENIFMISGWSALDFDQEAKNSLQEDYFFSKYNHIWGWATWKRAWKFYQKEFSDFENEFSLLKFDTQEEKKTWYRIFKLYNEGKIDTWDYPWTYTIWKNQGLCIYPKNNMVQNIGLNRTDATNTKTESKFQNMITYEITKKILHPKEIVRNIYLDKKNFLISFRENSLFVIIINKISRILFGRNCIKI